MKNTLSNIAAIALLVLAGLVGGYFVGKNSVKVEERTMVEYRELPAVQVSVRPEPLRVSVPEVPRFLFFTDTVTGVRVVDTAAMLADWVLKREYGGRMIEDSTGRVDYSAVVQYNRLQNLSLDYVPVQRVVTTTKVMKDGFVPFVFIGGNGAGFGAVEAGAFIGRFGVAAEVGTDFAGTNYFGGKIGWRF